MTKKQKKALLRIVLSALLFLAGLALKLFCPKLLSGWAQIVLFLAAWALCGYPVILEAFENLFHGQIFDENFLMTLATVGAIALKDFPEAAGVMIFFQIGELFESIAVHRSRKSISALMDLRPDFATVLENGTEVRKDPEEVQFGDILLVRPGERIPVDGKVLDGTSALDTSKITGESVPRSVTAGDKVLSGCVNQNGVLKIIAESSYEASTVAKILELVESSAEQKAPAERMISRFARFYTPAVVIGAVLLALLPPLLFQGAWTEWIRRALTFLVISCPCALVISVPLSYFGGMGAASKLGVVVKGGTVLDQLAKARVTVFDKTGTLTTGEFGVQAIYPVSVSQIDLLKLAASCETYSTHPVAQAIRAAFPDRPIRPEQTNELPGCGIEAQIEGKRVLAGNQKLMLLNQIRVPELPQRGTLVYLARDGEYLGAIAVGDRVREGMKDTLAQLKACGIRKNIMLTGDIENAASAAAEELSLDDYAAELLPQDKVEKVRQLLSDEKDGTVLFAGDGVNDAPVLALADVGIAMGGVGSDAAVEAADVVFLNDELSKLPRLLKIAAKTKRIARQNIIFALFVKAVVLILGALGYAPMWLAVFADVGVAMIAILNAVRTLRAA